MVMDVSSQARALNDNTVGVSAFATQGFSAPQSHDWRFCHFGWIEFQGEGQGEGQFVYHAACGLRYTCTLSRRR